MTACVPGLGAEGTMGKHSNNSTSASNNSNPACIYSSLCAYRTESSVPCVSVVIVPSRRMLRMNFGEEESGLFWEPVSWDYLVFHSGVWACCLTQRCYD